MRPLDFQVGDTVVCVDAAGYPKLVKGGLYIIEDIPGGSTMMLVRPAGGSESLSAFMSRFRYGTVDVPGDKVTFGEVAKLLKMPPATAASIKESNPKDSIGVRKAPLSCVPATVLLELGVAMQEGAHKYRRHNYRAIGVRASVYYDATMRHLFSWWEGEDIDPDSGLSHVTKAIASLTVLRDAMIQGKFHDDRPPKSVPFVADLNKKTAELADRFADTSKPPYTERPE